MMMNTICYKTKEDVVYNKGTKYETKCNEFLYKYTYKDKEKANAEIDALNEMLKAGVEKYDGLEMNNIKEFFLNEQEEMY